MTFWKGQGILALAAGFAGVMVACWILYWVTENKGLALCAGLATAAGLTWSFHKQLERKGPPGTRHVAFFIPLPLWTWVYTGLLAPALAMAAVGWHAQWEESKLPGYTAFKAADDKIDDLKQGKAHGNTLPAEAAAHVFSQTIRMNRAMNKRSGADEMVEPENNGEFLTYCHEAKDFIVFLIHVPELINLKSEQARSALIKDVWNLAVIQARSIDMEGKKTMIVGLRGHSDYMLIIRGRPKQAPIVFNDGRKADLLIPPFAEDQAVPVTPES
ncbi:hypothetical protein [Haloferula sp. BvORR071]|uniref:hypothetical protein n=1 Tax=Haloferula sp. BvORR071 TaxID=1396141 RepID=UPI000558B750|nr:hypothetical protein [Haloferula sp. BvORR071]